MKYIIENELGFTTYDNYFKYVDSIKSSLSEKLYSFASDPERYDLRSQKTLHDAWIEHIEVNYRSTGCDEVRKIDIALTLLGQHHDRKHQLLYKGVHSYSFKNMDSNGRINNDLLLHEIRLEGELIAHEIIFDNGVEILITCFDITHDETITE